MDCVTVFACMCVGCCVVRRACYTDRARPLEWNAWWDSVMSRKSLNKHGWFQLTPQCVHVCVCMCVAIRPVCLCCVHWSFLLKPSWIFFLLKYSVLLSLCPPSFPCWLLSFIFYSLDSLFRLHHSFPLISNSLSTPLCIIFSLGFIISTEIVSCFLGFSLDTHSTWIRSVEDHGLYKKVKSDLKHKTGCIYFYLINIWSKPQSISFFCILYLFIYSFIFG